MKARQERHIYPLDGSSDSRRFDAYPFLNKFTKPDIMSMEEIVKFENSDNPKDAIRRLVEESNKRRKAMQMDDLEPALTTAKKPVTVKT